MIRFIIGLGNPEEKYNFTPHNAGRYLVESVKNKKQFQWKKEKWFDWTDSNPSFVRLHSYMNESGEAVRELLTKFKCGAEEILICTDDFDLPLETIRIRKKGSAGSHNGLRSVIECLNTEEFPRLRLGIGPLSERADPIKFVLTPFPKAQRKSLDAMVEKASEAIAMILDLGIEKAMNKFNTKAAV